MMPCPTCGTENRPGRKFCARCGGALALACPSCGTANEPGDAFCGECGTALGAAASPAAPRPEAVAERRLVTVLFADLVGFTTLSENRDAEEVRELLSRYFDTCRRLVGLYGGTIEKFIGDAVMAVWGTPTATEDDAERAVRAALDLLAAVSAMGDELGAPELRARAGVLTGEAAVTLGAEGQGMVAGDLVNTASRVQAAAEAGAVYVGEATRRATEETVVYEPAGEHELKGKQGLTPLWKALRVVSGVRGTLKSEGLEAPFVGRDRELRQIKELFHACADERKAWLVSVTGIAGIGKSRLGWEFYKYFDGIAQVVYWHRGRCLAYGDGVAYWALADMLRMRCRIAEDEQPEAALAKLRATLAEHVADPDERAFVEPRLAHLLGLGDHQARDRQDLFAAWRVFFERLAESNPTVLAFEDLQWADESLLDFVEYLLEWSRNHPILVVTLARPELLERRPNWGAGRRNFSSLFLEPLPEAAMEELLGGLVPGLPAALRAEILARAEGVPLYAVETVRMLLDRGLLAQEGSVYRPVGEIGELAVPETLHALIAARLDGLSPEERRLLQDGAVLGKTFTPEGVAALSGRPAGELEPLLQALVRKEVLSLQADPRSPEHGQYGFLQDLVRRVAYETLSRRDRRARHLDAAAHLESAVPEEDELAEVVAAHYVAAWEAVPDADDAQDVKRRAREALARAGERAASLAASGEAKRYFERAAGLADEAAERAALLTRAGTLATYAGKPAEAVALLEEAVALRDAEGDVSGSALATAQIADVLWRTGEHEQAASRAEAAYEVIAAAGPSEELAQLAAGLGRDYVFRGDVEQAAEWVEIALDVCESLALPEQLVGALSSKALIAESRGHPEESRALLERALAIALEHDLRAGAAGACLNLSDRAFRQDRFQEALGYLERGLELDRRLGSRPGEWSMLAEMTYPLHMTGRWDEALGLLEDLTDEQVASGAMFLSLLTSLLEIHLHRGELDRARRLHGLFDRLPGSPDWQDRGCHAAATAAIRRAEGRFEEALATAADTLEAARSIGFAHQAVKQGLVEALEAALALGERGRADELLTRIEKLPPGYRPPYLEAQALRLRARLAGDEAGLAEAAGRFRGLGIPFWVAVTQLERAELLSERGRGDDAGPPLAEARETFGRLGAAPWLERAARASGAGREPEPVPARS